MFKATVRRRKFKDLSKIGRLKGGPLSVKVGLPAGDADGGVIEYAAYNEFGTRSIPERPAIRNAIRSNRDKYRNAMKSGARQILLQGASFRTILSKLGVLAQGDIQEEITALRSPPNAPSTIRQKGSSNPLIDSGRYRQSITWKVDQ